MADDAKIRLNVDIVKVSSKKTIDSSLASKVKVMRKMLTQKTSIKAAINSDRAVTNNVDLFDLENESSNREND